MKKIGFIAKNKVLAQSLATLIRNDPDMPFDPYVLLNFSQAVIDAEILGIDVAVIEMIAETPTETGIVPSLCMELRKSNPDCQVFLLVPQDSKESCDTAMAAVNAKTADDYVFLDTSLDYLLAKLLAL